MTTFNKFALVMVGVVVGVLLSAFSGQFAEPNLGSVYNNVLTDFSEGISVDGVVIIDGNRELTALASVYEPAGDVTLTAAQSGSIVEMNTAGQDVTLPTASASVGAHYRFVVTGAVATTNMTIVASPADTIEGTLVVAGAVVDCDATDILTFVIDGENIGDYVELYTDGTSWLIGDSGVLTASKLTCTG
jgi:hypothetical protein